MKEHEEKRRRVVLAYQNVFASDDGKLVLEDLARQLFANKQTYIGGIPDASAFNQGMREAFLWIRGRIDTDLEAPKQTHAQTKEETT